MGNVYNMKKIGLLSLAILALSLSEISSAYAIEIPGMETKKENSFAVPEIKPEDISVSEGLRNLFNKLHTMLLGLSKKYDENQRKVSIFWSAGHQGIWFFILYFLNFFVPEPSVPK